MICSNCGKELKKQVKFCPNCGISVNDSNLVFDKELNEMNFDKETDIISYKENGQTVYISNSEIKKSPEWFLVVFTAFIIIGMFFIFILMFSSLVDMSNIEYDSIQVKETLEFGGDKVSTFYRAVDKKAKICEYSKNKEAETTYLEYHYCDIKLKKRDYDEYFEFLIESENFKEIETSTGRAVYRESVDDGYVILVKVDYDNDIIYYNKKLGTI